jgi:hypothetical protein
MSQAKQDEAATVDPLKKLVAGAKLQLLRARHVLALLNEKYPHLPTPISAFTDAACNIVQHELMFDIHRSEEELQDAGNDYGTRVTGQPPEAMMTAHRNAAAWRSLARTSCTATCSGWSRRPPLRRRSRRRSCSGRWRTSLSACASRRCACTCTCASLMPLLGACRQRERDCLHLRPQLVGPSVCGKVAAAAPLAQRRAQSRVCVHYMYSR